MDVVNYHLAFAAQFLAKDARSMIEKFPVTIPALTGKRRKRNVYVYVPDHFDGDPDMRFPVLYMFDGHNVFFDEDATYGKSWGMKEFLEQTGAPLIVVAVECCHDPKPGRLSEYAPFTFSGKKFGRIHGRGEITMDWFVNTLKPMIDDHYPTLPGRESTFIAGSSMGGLMSLYALLAHNDVSSRAAALSPAVWCCRRKMLALIRTADLAPDTVLYMDYGSREMSNHEGMREVFADVTASLMRRGVHVTSRIVPGGEHCEASWEEQLPYFINTLLYQRD